MIRGTIGDSATGAGLPVVIDIRGSNVVIECGDESWVEPAARVRVETLSPSTYRLVFGAEVFVLRPTDPLKVRLQFDHALAAAARRRRWRRGRTKATIAAETTASPHARWIRDNVEVEAVLPVADGTEGPAWVPSPTRNMALRA